MLHNIWLDILYSILRGIPAILHNICLDILYCNSGLSLVCCTIYVWISRTVYSGVSRGCCRASGWISCTVYIHLDYYNVNKNTLYLIYIFLQNYSEKYKPCYVQRDY
jgi:hypothetical protein